MANSVAETFGFLPEIVPSTSESRTPGAKHQMLPLHVISKLVSGTSTIGSSDEETTGASLELGPDLQVQFWLGKRAATTATPGCGCNGCIPAADSYIHRTCS